MPTMREMPEALTGRSSDIAGARQGRAQILSCTARQCEHIDKPAAFLRSALAHLRPGGWLIGSTIARHPVSYLTTKLVAEAPWPVGVVPAGTHDWDKYINKY